MIEPPGKPMAIARLAVQEYLHEHIPLSRAMGVEVVEASVDTVTLSAPLAQNINHRETVFGGSASAVAILSAWTLLHLKLKSEGVNGRVVIQRNTMNYERPISGAFTASATIGGAWGRFVEALRRKQRARIGLRASLHSNGAKVGAFEGDFVALLSSH